MSEDDQKKGGRPKGSKDKPKSIDELVGKLQAAFGKDGFDVQVTRKVDARVVKTDWGIDAEDAAELNIEEESSDTEDSRYTCGSCRATLSGPLAYCSSCGVGLRW